MQCFFAQMSSIAISDFSSVLPNASGPCFWTLELLSEPLQREHIQNSEIITSISKEGFEIKENELSFETDEVQLEWYCDTRNVLLKQEWKKKSGSNSGVPQLRRRQFHNLQCAFFSFLEYLRGVCHNELTVHAPSLACVHHLRGIGYLYTISRMQW